MSSVTDREINLCYRKRERDVQEGQCAAIDSACRFPQQMVVQHHGGAALRTA